MKSIDEIACFTNAQGHGDVFPQCPEPMSRTLTRRQESLVPETVDNPVGEDRYDGSNRDMMPRPVLSGADSVHTAAFRTPPALKPQRRGKAVEIAKHEPVPPNTGTAAPSHKTFLRPRKVILLSQPENLIDRHL